MEKFFLNIFCKEKYEIKRGKNAVILQKGINGLMNEI